MFVRKERTNAMQERERERERGGAVYVCVCVCGVLVILGEILLQMTCTLAHTCALINNNHDRKKKEEKEH